MFQITCQCLASELGVILVFLCRTAIDVIKVVIFEQLTICLFGHRAENTNYTIE
jgi:hypothetical protein